MKINMGKLSTAYWWPQSKGRQIKNESDKKAKTKHINWEIHEEIHEKDCRKAKSGSLMQTSIFSIFNLDLYQKIKLNLCFEVWNESHKEFLSITLPFWGLLDVQFAQLEKGLWAGTEDQAESMMLPNKHSIYLLIFWSIHYIACRSEDQYHKRVATFKEIFQRLDHAFST